VTTALQGLATEPPALTDKQITDSLTIKEYDYGFHDEETDVYTSLVKYDYGVHTEETGYQSSKDMIMDFTMKKLMWISLQ
jgi:hypothetical protein